MMMMVQQDQQLLLSKQQQQQSNGNISTAVSSSIAEGLTTTANSPSLNVQQERPSHYTYLKEFRVEACPLFKQHQCTNHRPYSCFYWHFANQRRRRPLRRKDGTFNYSADVYCTKYDENTGVCPDGDDCPYLHRVYGDVERKYHLRYYKTALCVHPTDAKGHCTKNGAHCAFAHGPDDVRNPLFDLRQLQACGEVTGESIDNRERLNFVVEDPLWQDQEHVLVYYKTEPCKKPPRLCRQGYACPFYHSSKDKRRQPGGVVGSSSNSTGLSSSATNANAAANAATTNSTVTGNGSGGAGKYRSTPCPNVKYGDEWGDPEACEAGDACSYCHTRTEQQFHPEIYKSTKCNDMLQHGYCPRGAFCAFAHTDGELHGERRASLPSKRSSSISSGSGGSTNTATTAASSFANIVAANELKHTKSLDNNNPNTGAPVSGSGVGIGGGGVSSRRMSVVDEFVAPTLVVAPRQNALGQEQQQQIQANPMTAAAENGNFGGALSYSSVLKQRQAGAGAGITQQSSTPVKTAATASTIGAAGGANSAGDNNTTAMIATNTSNCNYSKAPGYEREQQSPTRPWPLSSMMATQTVGGGGGSLSPSVPLGTNDKQQIQLAAARTCEEVSRIKSSLYFHHEIGCDVGMATTAGSGTGTGTGSGSVDTPPTPGSMRSNSFSPFANGGGGGITAWQQQQNQNHRETVESVVGSIVEDINLEELVLPPISEWDERGESLPSSLSQYAVSPGLYGTSAPVTIPGSSSMTIGNFLTSGALGGSMNHHHHHQTGAAAGSAKFSSPQFTGGGSNSYAGAPLLLASSGGGDNQIFRLSGSFGQSAAAFLEGGGAGRPSRSGSVSGGSNHALSGNVLITELQRTSEELSLTRNKLLASEENAKQARQECAAWRREANEQRRRVQMAEQERVRAEQERDGTNTQLTLLTNELKSLQLSGLWPASNTELMPHSQLEQLHSRLRGELDRVERQLQQRATGPMCARCGRHVNGSAVPGTCPVCSPNSKATNGQQQYALAT